MAIAPIPPARPAATVVLLRDGADGPEVYLQRRHAGMSFGGAWVFPGGRIDDADADPAIDARWDGPPPAAWAERLGLPVDQARGAVVAGCRETLEEAGVLLADRALPAATVADARRALLDGEPFAALLGAAGVRLATGLLRYWAWWVTPELETRRFDTRFFVAGLPPGMAVAAHSHEADRERWVPLRSAAADDDLPVAPPTQVTLRDLAAYGSVAEVLAGAGDRRIEQIMPGFSDGWILLPWGERLRPHPSLLRGRDQGRRDG
jgi:8-oxo-dGTP pyrophosphatase MutT (NUDIX family)